MRLSAYADPESSTWDVSIDGRWLGAGPGVGSIVDFTAFDPASYESARLIAVWLTSGETYSLSALRPAHAKGQDRDEFIVRLPESDTALQAFDSRLSTEYSATGAPQRFGIELWLGEDAEGDQRALRLGGESDAGTGPGTSSTASPYTHGPLSIHPMRAHGADASGFGLYLLVHP